jgi:hypothetical protein
MIRLVTKLINEAQPNQEVTVSELQVKPNKLMSTGVLTSAVGQLEKLFQKAASSKLIDSTPHDLFYASVEQVIEEIKKIKNLEDYTYTICKIQDGKNFKLLIELVEKVD